MSSPIRLCTQNAEDSPDVLEYICIAADQLQIMISELRSLGVATRRFTLAMSSREPDMLSWLALLHETVDRLTLGSDPFTEAALAARATQLISWLSHEIDELTLCAFGEEYRSDSCPRPH